MSLLVRGLSGAIMLTAALPLPGPGRSASPAEGTGVLLTGPTMGTRYSVRVDDPGTRAAERVIDALIVTTLDRIDRRMSTYRADSEISELNRAVAGQPVALSPETLGVLSAALDLSVDTGGAFDVTAGPLINAWGFGPAGRGDAPPSEAAIAIALGHVGVDKIALDIAAGTAIRLDGEAYVDLSGIAKGYAVDAVDTALAQAGWTRTLVEVGGEVRTRGASASGRDWRISIEQPDAGVQSLSVALADGALATSGNYRNFYHLGSATIGHMIDPRTGRPAAHDGASVSVLAADCMSADALATALMVMGPDEGLGWATERDIAALFIVHAGDTFVHRATPAYRRHAETTIR